MPPASATRPALSLATSLMMARYNKLRAAIRTNDNPTLTITPLQLSSLVAPPPALLKITCPREPLLYRALAAAPDYERHDQITQPCLRCRNTVKLGILAWHTINKPGPTTINARLIPLPDTIHQLN